MLISSEAKKSDHALYSIFYGCNLGGGGGVGGWGCSHSLNVHVLIISYAKSLINSQSMHLTAYSMVAFWGCFCIVFLNKYMCLYQVRQKKSDIKSEHASYSIFYGCNLGLFLMSFLKRTGANIK